MLPGLALLVVVVLGVATAKGGDARLYPPDPRGAVAIFVIDNGYHSDLALPAASLVAGDDPVAVAARRTGRRPWIMFGWGDERFYTEEGFSAARAGDGLRALFMPNNPSVVRVEGLAAAPDKLFSPSAEHRVWISPAGLAGMRRRIDAAMALSAAGAPQPLGLKVADDPDAIFYRGKEHFSILHLCNHWTGDVLNAGGLPVTPLLDTLPAGLKLDLRLRAHA
jgi:hypothetical protein